MSIEVVTLRTGAEVPKPLVGTTWIALTSLMADNPIAVYEAAQIARDASHVPFGNAGAALKSIGLLESDGSMHGAVRDVILAATEGDLDLHLVSPYAATEPQS
jgi:hypothetical protein